MTSNFRLRKLYRRYEEGMIADAIVLYCRLDYEQKTVDRGDKAYIYISEYEHRMVIDLWLVVVRLRWFAKGKDPYATTKA